MEMHRWHTSSLAVSQVGGFGTPATGEMKLRVGWALGDQKSEMYKNFAIEIDFFDKDYDTYCEKVDILIIDCFHFWRMREELDLFPKIGWINQQVQN